jgi:hypothetical protein
VSLFIDDEKVGEGAITTQPGNLSLVGEGLNVGKDPASPVTDDYPGARPYAFTGGTIKAEPPSFADLTAALVALSLGRKGLGGTRCASRGSRRRGRARA